MKTSPKELQEMFVRGLVENQGAELEEYHGLKILRYERNGNPCVRIFKGNSSKSIANYRYSSVERREESVGYYKVNAKMEAERKAERKAKKALVSNETVEIGTIYYSSWGYEQTNIDFYEVVGRYGKKGCGSVRSLQIAALTLTSTTAEAAKLQRVFIAVSLSKKC